MGFRADFRLFKRTLPSGRKVYYYYSYDPFGRRKQCSTGCTRKSEAYRYCLDLMMEKSLIRKEYPTFREFTKNFYLHNACPILKRKNARGTDYSKSTVDKQRGHLVRHIYPYIGDMKLDKITPLVIEEFIVHQVERKMSNHTVNRYIDTLRSIFNYIYSIKAISNNPMDTIKPLQAKNTREKGILEENQVEELFNKINIDRIWNGDPFHYYLNKLAASSGMRLGEIQALKKEYIRPGEIEVCHSWDRSYGLKGTKSGTKRIVPISEELYQGIMAIAETNTEGPYIFSVDGKQPIDHKAVVKWFYRALTQIGIDPKKRKELNISFHSWRHYCNSRLLAEGVHPLLVQMVIGHKSDSMTENYAHLTASDLKDVLQALGRV